MSSAQIGIAAQAYFLPPEKRSVEQIFANEDIPFGTLAKNIDFKRDIGIQEVHVSGDLPSAMALKAVKRLMAQSNISGDDIDMIIDFTSLPEDYIGPTWSVAGLIQKEIGAPRAFATAIAGAGCADFHISLKVACAYMEADDSISTILLAAGDRTPDLNKTYYPITVASDVGCAFIIQKGCGRGVILANETISVGRLHDVWYVRGIEHRAKNQPASEKDLHMFCDMKRFNEGVIPINFFMFNKIIQKVLAKAGKSINEVDAVIYPTFSTWDLKNFSEATGIPRSKMYTRHFETRGHMQECDMIVNYADAVHEEFIKPGDLVMAISNGAGFAWSAALIQH